MTPVVLDASAALALLLPTQTTTAGDAFFANADNWLFRAPYIFDWEVRNVLLSRRRKTLSADAYASALDLLDELAVAVIPPLDRTEFVQLTKLAEATGLSLFDACYLAVAIEDEIGVAGRDEALLDAVKASGLPVYDLR